MRTKLILAGFSILTLAVTSCNDDEVVQANTGNAIEFSATAGKETRAAATTTNTIDNFKVWGFTQGEAYFPGLTVTKTAGKWSYGDPKFWPATALDFYAVSPSTIDATVTEGAQTINDYTVPGDVDLLYSAELGATKTSADVQLNFRHALSQVAFKASLTDDAKIDVEIKSIKVAGVSNSGTFTWGSQTTKDWLNTPDFSTATNDTEYDTNADGNYVTGLTWGTWSNIPAAVWATEYPVITDGDYTLVANGAKADGTTPSAVTSFDFTDNALFLLPQTLNPWLTYTTDADGNQTAKITGVAHILVDCRIVDHESGVQLWPEVDDTNATLGQTAEVAVSLTNPSNDPNKDKDGDHARWMQGKKYVYTLIFGKGGGFTPDPNGPDPDPVLVPITFSVTVDDFQDGGSYDLNAN